MRSFVADALPGRATRVRSLPAGLVLAGAGVLAAVGYLLAELVPDVASKPMFPEEALSGEVAARPFFEVLKTVIWERGAAPLHFVLAHVALVAQPSEAAVRWISVVFAVGLVLVCFDLGRRLAGPVAGVTAAVVAATSSVLAVYGTYGRTYALFAFCSAVAVDLFVRALDERTAGAAAIAAAAAWLPAASHPYGIMLVAAEAAVALAVWRGRPLRPALPVAAIALLFVPLLVADLRLSGRFGVGAGGPASVASPQQAFELLQRALASFTGGGGVWLGLFLVLGATGLVVLGLRRGRDLAFAVFALLVLIGPPIAMTLAGSGENVSNHLLPRHLVFALPVWAALVGAAVAWIAARVPASAAVAIVAAVAALALLAPAGGTPDPRTRTGFYRFTGGERGLAAPATWLEGQVTAEDVTHYPYSPVFMAALPAVRHATSFNRDESTAIRRALGRVHPPVRAAFVAVPLANAHLDRDALRRTLGARSTFFASRPWLVIRADGPFADDAAVVRAALDSLRAARGATTRKSGWLVNYFIRTTQPLAQTLDALER